MSLPRIAASSITPILRLLFSPPFFSKIYGNTAYIRLNLIKKNNRYDCSKRDYSSDDFFRLRQKASSQTVMFGRTILALKDTKQLLQFHYTKMFFLLTLH